MIKLNNLIMVCGSAKKTGKTTLCCRLIEYLSAKHEVLAIKTTSHQHGTTQTCIIIAQGTGFTIYMETDTEQHDSGRMLKAGATKSLYIEALEQNEPEAVKACLPLVPQNTPIIMETASWFKYFKPGKLIYIADAERMEKNPNLASVADFIIASSNGKLEQFEPSELAVVQ